MSCKCSSRCRRGKGRWWKSLKRFSRKKLIRCWFKWNGRRAILVLFLIEMRFFSFAFNVAELAKHEKENSDQWLKTFVCRSLHFGNKKTINGKLGVIVQMPESFKNDMRNLIVQPRRKLSGSQYNLPQYELFSIYIAKMAESYIQKINYFFEKMFFFRVL